MNLVFVQNVIVQVYLQTQRDLEARPESAMLAKVTRENENENGD